MDNHLADQEFLDSSHQPALDAEFGHGAAIDNIAEPLILYRNRKRAIKHLNKYFKSVMLLPALMVVWTLCVAPQFWAAIIPVVIWYGIVYASIRRAHTKALRPVLEIRPEGLVINSFLTEFTLIPWSEIEEVRSYRDVYQFVGIVPQSWDKTASHASPMTRFFCSLNQFFVPFYTLCGRFMAPINIPQDFLPLEADEVADQINARRAYALGICATKNIESTS